MSFDAGAVTATLELDRSQFIRSLAAARKDAARFAKQAFEATLKANVNPLNAAIRSARSSLTRFDGESYEATLGADFSRVATGVTGAKRLVESYAGKTYAAILSADYSRVRTDVAAATTIAANFARQSYEASLGVRGTTQTVSELRTVDQAADQVDGRDVTLDIDADSTRITSLSDSFKGLASNIRATGTVLRASAIPFGIAAIGGGVPAVAALAASVSGLAVALGQGLVGAAVAAGGAMGTLGGAIALVAAPVKMLLGNLKEYDQGLETVSSSQQAAKAASQTLADAQKREQQALEGVTEARRTATQALDAQKKAVEQAQNEGAAAILAQERRINEVRASGNAEVKQEEQRLKEIRVEAVRAVEAQERTLRQTRQTVAVDVAAKEAELESAREQLTSATRSLSAAQRELNIAQRDEPLNQLQATYDLADARDAASDAARALAEAEAEYGKNSEEASDARRALRQANLDLEVTERAVRDTRKNGSDELQSATEAAKAAAAEQKKAAEAEKAAQQGVNRARVDGVRQIKEQQRLLRQIRADAATDEDKQLQVIQQANRARIREEASARAELRRITRQANSQLAEEEQRYNQVRREGIESVEQAQETATEATRAAAQAAQAAAQATKDLKKETVKLTPAQKELYDEYKRFEKLGDKAFRPAQDAAARLGVDILKLAETYLPRLGKTSEDAVNALSRAFSTFREELARPIVQSGITAYLQLIPKFTETAATAAGKMGIALFNAFSRSFKYVMPFARGMEDLADQFLRFTESAEGRNKIDRFFAGAVAMGKRLVPIMGDLVGGFTNLIGALQRTGIVDQSVRGFGALASAFERSTREGGGLDRFLRNARDLMPFVGGAARKVAGAIFGIADAVISAREKGDKLTILQGIFRSLGNAAKPLQRLVVGTFKNLGPVIRNLLPPLTRFLESFGGGATQALGSFIDTLGGAVRLFNRLPDNVQSAIGKFAALSVILKSFGIAALVAPMGRFATNMFIANRAASKLGGKTGLKAVVASVGALALRGGVIGLAIAGVAGLAFVLKRAYDKNKNFRESVDKLKGAAGEAYGKIAKRVRNDLLPTLDRLANKGATAILDAFDLTGEDKNRIKQSGRSATAQYGLGIRQGTSKQTGEGSAAYELGFKVGKSIKKGLFNFFKTDDPAGGPPRTWREKVIDVLTWQPPWIKAGREALVGLLDGLFGPRALDKAAAFLKNPLGKIVGWIKKGIKEAGWSRVGSFIIDKIVEGLLGVNLSRQVKVETAKAARGAKEQQPLFISAGKNAAAGYIQGWRQGGVGGGIVGAVKGAYEGVRKWQKERSPAKRWIPSGKNAALGFVKGFRDARIGDQIAKDLENGMKNLRLADPRDSFKRLRGERFSTSGSGFNRAQRIDPTRFSSSSNVGEQRVRRAHEQALKELRSKVSGAQVRESEARMRVLRAHEAAITNLRRRDSEMARVANRRGDVGGRSRPGLAWDKARGINKEEMREVSRESNRELIAGFARAMRENIRGGMSAGQLDAALGGYINHRNSMRPDVR